MNPALLAHRIFISHAPMLSLMEATIPSPRSWKRRLCKLADAVDAAEVRRIEARTPAERAQAEADLDAAFKALYRYYLRFPFQIRLNDESWKKAKRLVEAWTRHVQRIGREKGSLREEDVES